MMKRFVLSLFLAAACGDLMAITATKEYVDKRDAYVITNVVKTATNETLVAAKGYADNLASGLVPTSRKINGQPLTNDITIAGGVTSVNTKTGDVTLVASDVGAVPTTGGIMTGPIVLRRENESTLVQDITISTNGVSGWKFTGSGGVGYWSQFSFNWWDLISSESDPTVPSWAKQENKPTYTASEVGAVPTSRKINGQPLTNDITIAGGVTSVNTKTGDVTLTASDVGAYPNSSGTSLAGQVQTIGAHLNAEDARFVSTNYNSTTHMPEAYVEVKLPDTTWSVVWREMTRWNWLLDTYLPTNFYTKGQTDAALSQKADCAWGFYESHSGTYAPDGYTWISSPKIAIAADMGYQRTITSEGAIWVLESRGLITETGGVASNGFFRISDDDGNVHFEIIKGNKRTIPADASSCQVVAGFTPTKLQIGYSVVAETHPTLYICNSLTTQQWKSETDADCLANVTWEGSSGAYVAYVQGKTAQTALFVKATYETGEETYIRNVAPVSMEYMYVGGVKYSVGTATISGNTVLTLTPAP